jgi:hypothetical protein
MSYGNLSWPSATNRWRLDGPANGYTDMLVAALIDAGMTAEVITPRTAFRLDGPAGRLVAIAGQLADLEGGAIKLAPEPVPQPAINLSGYVAPARAFRRTVFVHGGGEAFTYVARAIDSRLVVTSAGSCRWAVTGRTADLLVWLSEHVHNVPIDEVLKLWNLTVDAARAEDADLPPVPTINIVMPGRKTTTEKIVRNDDGAIVRVEQVTKDEE